MADENLIGYIETDLKNTDDCFALRVVGDSMIEAGIMDGDTVIVDRREDAENGEMASFSSIDELMEDLDD